MEEVHRRRVVVGVSGSANSLTALRFAAAEARSGGRTLLAVMAWQPSGRAAAPGAPEAVVAGDRDAAVARLIDVLHAMFGTREDGLSVEGVVLHGRAGPELVLAADRDDDLLVVGTGHRGRLLGLRSPVARHCLSRASCPVLAVPPSQLQLHLEAMDRRGRRLAVRPRDAFDGIRTIAH